MKLAKLSQCMLISMGAIVIGLPVPAGAEMIDGAATYRWKTVVNNKVVMPDSTKTFNSYNQPSINNNGLVVMRARSKGGSGVEPVHGIYTRDMKNPGNSKIVKILDRTTKVPDPNNTEATFNETPSFPRMDADSDTFAFRGSSAPVWNVTDPVTGAVVTKLGTTSLFMPYQGKLINAVNQLGASPGFARFQVPGANALTKFDQFPGAPSPYRNKVAFKGNYTQNELQADGVTLLAVGKTGVFYRDVKKKGGLAEVIRVADTKTRIPNQPKRGQVTFGSTAPPSVSGERMVFAGFDNEDAPSLGGIYIAQLVPNAKVRTLVGIGDSVPEGGRGATFNKIGEGMSFNGRWVAFWGAWGVQTKQVTLVCPTDGNKARIQYCLEHDNNKVVDVPINQGFFVHDSITHKTTMLAQTGENGLDEFLYWNYSGSPPNTGPGDEGESDGSDEGDDREPPRWRSSAFVAVSNVRAVGTVIAYKATTANKAQGIYLTYGPGVKRHNAIRVLDTTTLGQTIDPEAPAGSVVTSLGIERDGFRGRRLALTASMVDPVTTESIAGVYVTKVSKQPKAGE